MFDGFANRRAQAAAADRTRLRFFASGACGFPGSLFAALAGSRHFAGLDEQFSILNFVVVLEQSALRRSGGARAVLVIGAAVAGTHEEVRLREPANRTSQVRAVDGEDLESLVVNISDPACDVARSLRPTN